MVNLPKEEYSVDRVKNFLYFSNLLVFRKYQLELPIENSRLGVAISEELALVFDGGNSSRILCSCFNITWKCPRTTFLQSKL